MPDLFNFGPIPSADYFKIWSDAPLWWEIKDNMRISLGQDGDGFLWNTMFNDSLLRSATENRWDRHFILINAPNGFAQTVPSVMHAESVSPSYFRVDNAYSNPSRLTVIIRIIRRADIWYELSWWLLPVKYNSLGQPGNLDSRSQ